MTDRAIVFPWSRDAPPRTVLPAEGLTDPRAIQMAVIAGFADGDGVLQPYVPVGGSVNALPARDTLTTILATQTLGPLGVLTSDQIDMTEWELFTVIITSDTDLSGGMSVDAIADEGGAAGMVYFVQRLGNNDHDTIYYALALAGVLSSSGTLYFTDNQKIFAGTKIKLRLTSNDGINSSEVSIQVRRFRRVHG